MLLRILDSFLVIFRHGTHRQGPLRFVFLEISFKAIKHTFTSPPCLFSLSLSFFLSRSLSFHSLSPPKQRHRICLHQLQNAPIPLGPSAVSHWVCHSTLGPRCPGKSWGPRHTHTHTHTHTHFIIHYSQAVFLFLPWVCSLFDIICSGLQRAGLHPPSTRQRSLALCYRGWVTSAALCWVTLVKLYLQ